MHQSGGECETLTVVDVTCTFESAYTHSRVCLIQFPHSGLVSSHYRMTRSLAYIKFTTAFGMNPNDFSRSSATRPGGI